VFGRVFSGLEIDDAVIPLEEDDKNSGMEEGMNCCCCCCCCYVEG